MFLLNLKISSTGTWKLYFLLMMTHSDLWNIDFSNLLLLHLVWSVRSNIKPASTTQNIRCPSIMTPSKMGKTKKSHLLFSNETLAALPTVADRIQLTSVQLWSDAPLQWAIAATPLSVNYETARSVRRAKRQCGKWQASMKAALGHWCRPTRVNMIDAHSQTLKGCGMNTLLRLFSLVLGKM